MIPVLDANIVLKSAIDETEEPGAQTARTVIGALMEIGRVAAPSLLSWEIGQVAHVKHRDRFGSDLDERQTLVQAMLAGIDLVPPGRRAMTQTARLAESHELSFYDAAYLELAARGRDGLLITEDRRLLRAGKDVLGEAGCMDTATAWQAIQDGQL